MKLYLFATLLIFIGTPASAEIISIAGDTGREIYEHLAIAPVKNGLNGDIELFKADSLGNFTCSYLIPPVERYVCRLNVAPADYVFQKYALVVEGDVARALFGALDFPVEQVSEYSNVGGASAFAIYGQSFHCTDYQNKYCCIF